MRTQLAEVRQFPATAGYDTSSALSERAVLMASSTLFSGLSAAECLHLASCGRTRRFANDEILFMQGQRVQQLMLIMTGSVKLTQLSSTGNEVILWMTGAKQAIGLSARPSGEEGTHSCTARAMEPCTALIWDYARHAALLEQYPRIRGNVNHILSTRLEELEERFREVSTERVAKRLALALLRLMRHVGRPHQSGTRVSLSREEMAQMIGTTLFTTSRILSKWSESGLVLARRDGVVICDARCLEQEAEMA